jgi:hypothetical protein
MAATITEEITGCNTVPELETVFIEHSGSFDYIHASAALVKYAKLPGSSKGSAFFSKLASVWQQQLPAATRCECANVLWACSKLGSAQHPVWAETWQAFIDLIRKELIGGQTPSLQAQELSSVLYACAKLQQQLHPNELLLLLEAFLHPDVVATAVPQAVANVIWSMGRLSIEPALKAEVSQELLQRLLAPEMLTVAAAGSGQAVSNVLVGLVRMCTGPSPLLPTAVAQGYAGELLSGVQLGRVGSWHPQPVTNSLWALGELQLRDDRFIRALAAAAQKWLPRSSPREVSQAATACAQLQYQDEHFMGMILQRAEQILQLGADTGRRSGSRRLPAWERDSIPSMCCVSVVLLDLRGLADGARKLVADSNIKQQGRTHPSNLRRLWVFHSWLLEHQLLDGKGLEGLVTQKQLQQGAKEAAEWGNKTSL